MKVCSVVMTYKITSKWVFLATTIRTSLITEAHNKRFGGLFSYLHYIYIRTSEAIDSFWKKKMLLQSLIEAIKHTAAQFSTLRKLAATTLWCNLNSIPPGQTEQWDPPWCDPSIHPFSAAYRGPGRGGIKLSNGTQTSFSPATLVSSSWGIPRCSQAGWDM